MANFLVLGAGRMGVVLAKDLIESSPQNKVTLVNRSEDKLKRAEDFIRSKNLFSIQKDMAVEKERKAVIEGQDVVICALLHEHSLPVLETAVHCAVHYVDLVGEAPLERLKNHKLAQKNGITVISGIGLSPGITNICVGRAVHLLDEVEKALIYVGGNPARPQPPLNYRVVYAISSLLNFYEKNVLIIKEGRLMELPPLSGLESISFPPEFPEMECFYSHGLNSLLYTMQGKIQGELSKKTIRYQGHIEGIKTLQACGLFSTQPILVNHQEVIPRRVLEAILDSRMKLGDEGDVTLMRIIVQGTRAKKSETHLFEMIDYYDQEKKYTSMSKTTSFPASLVAQMIANGELSERGVIFPENVFYGDLFETFIEKLRQKQVNLSYEVITKE